MGKRSVSIVLLAAVVAGFFCSVASRAASAAEKAVIQYRLEKQKTMHLDDEKTAKSHDQSLRKLGCESKLGGHSGHFDLTYRCPKWREAAFDGHDEAHRWQKWLKSLGFETAHAH
jgi:hypothetical protein